jgi:hypothetical protein
VWPRGDAAWILLLLAGGAILWLTRRRPSEPVGGDAHPEGGTEPETKVLAAQDSRRVRRLGRAILIAVGSLVALAVAAAAIFVAVFPVHLGRGVGHRTYAPAALADLNRSYRLGVGGLRLDLTNVRLPVGETEVSARVDVGGLRVIVPSDAAVRVRGDVRLGYLNLLGEADHGRKVDDTVTETGERMLVLDTHVGVGSVRVTRAVR